MVTWTREKIELFKQLYPHKESHELMQEFGCSKSAVKNMQSKLGLQKAKDYKGMCGRFQKGNVAFNKGKKLTDVVKCPIKLANIKSTWFKKGITPHNTKHKGAERVSKDGYIEIRVRKGKYMLKHRRLFMLKNGPLAPGQLVKFKDGNRLNVTSDNLYLTNTSQNMADNTIMRYPSDLRELIKLSSKLKKTIIKNQ